MTTSTTYDFSVLFLSSFEDDDFGRMRPGVERPLAVRAESYRGAAEKAFSLQNGYDPETGRPVEKVWPELCSMSVGDLLLVSAVVDGKAVKTRVIICAPTGWREIGIEGLAVWTRVGRDGRRALAEGQTYVPASHPARSGEVAETVA